MNSVGDLLRNADPLAHEPVWSSQQRLAIEARVVAASRTMTRVWPRRAFITAVVTFVLVAAVAIAPRFSSSALQAAVLFEVRLAEETSAPELEPPITLPSGRTIYLHETAVVTNADIAEARVVQGDSRSTFAVEVTLNADGAKKMWLATSNHVGRHVAILIDGKVVAAPVVRISDRRQSRTQWNLHP